MDEISEFDGFSTPESSRPGGKLQRAACDPKQPVEIFWTMTDVVEIASRFANALFSGDGDSAYEFLSDELRGDVAAVALSSQFASLGEDRGGVTGIVRAMMILEEWPEMSADDRSMVYVPLEGDDFSEAITVKVSEIDNAVRISSIEWGRP